MEDKKKEINEEELQKITGGIIKPDKKRCHCYDCHFDFETPKNNSCPNCRGKNFRQSW